MAVVRKGDRAKTKQRTGDTSFPMETGAQIRSAIRLRGKGKKKTSSEVLNLASRAVTRLLEAGKISKATATALRNKIAAARKNQGSRS